MNEGVCFVSVYGLLECDVLLWFQLVFVVYLCFHVSL